MAIAFRCPSCNRPYRVSDSLAGKTAKCGQCATKMKVPRPRAPRAKAPQLKSPQPKPAEPKLAEPAPVTSNDEFGSWMEDELASVPPAASASASNEVTCPSCGASQPSGATMCGSCGATVPTGSSATASTAGLQPAPYNVKPQQPQTKRTVSFDFKLGSMGTLIRGTVLSMVFAMCGVGIWAIVAVFTMREFGIIAWGLGGLAGVGMALGHDDDDGTTAGIIAAFVSLFGIVAAKLMIVALVVVVAVAAIAGNEGGVLDGMEFQREILIGMLAEEDLTERGIAPGTASDAQFEAAAEKARAVVTQMSDEEVGEKMREVMEAAAAEMEEPDQTDIEGDPIEPAAADVQEMAQVDVVQPAEPGFLALFFQSMFSPMDGVFMLLAFFTAYKVGSGQQTD